MIEVTGSLTPLAWYEWHTTIGSRLLAKLIQLPPAKHREVTVERDLAAKMADGVVLLADRWGQALTRTSSVSALWLDRSQYPSRESLDDSFPQPSGN